MDVLDVDQDAAHSFVEERTLNTVRLRTRSVYARYRRELAIRELLTYRFSRLYKLLAYAGLYSGAQKFHSDRSDRHRATISTRKRPRPRSKGGACLHRRADRRRRRHSPVTSRRSARAARHMRPFPIRGPRRSRRYEKCTSTSYACS